MEMFEYYHLLPVTDSESINLGRLNVTVFPLVIGLIKVLFEIQHFFFIRKSSSEVFQLDHKNADYGEREPY